MVGRDLIDRIKSPPYRRLNQRRERDPLIGSDISSFEE